VEPGEDIVARAESAAGSSAGALAAYIGRSCGHVWLDSRVIAQGYRFYPWMSDEIPQFFNKRFTTGSVNLAVTLQAGVSLDGEDPLEECTSTKEAKDVLDHQELPQTLWLAVVTMGNDLLHIDDISDPLFLARHPNEFRIVAEELVSLGVLQSAACPLCASSRAH
jgi:hypothetical protein